MPFTLSHITAVLPIKDMKTKGGHNLFDVTALIIGSMAPDFEFFIQMRPIKQAMNIPIGHTLSGMFYYGLPLCFLFAWIFHRIIKRPLFLHLPQCLAKQYTKYAFQKWQMKSWKSFFVFSYSALLAMAIHILWDSFTHSNSPVVQQIAWLSVPVNIFSYTIPVFKILDHSGTVLGLIIVLYYLYSFGRNELFRTTVGISSYQKMAYFTTIFSIGIVVELLWLYRYGIPGGKEEIAGPIIAFISGLFIGTTVISYLVSKIDPMEQINPRNIAKSQG